MCNLLRTSKKTFSTKIVKEAGQKQILMSEVTDIPLLIRKYCIIKKARVKLVTEPTLFMHFWCLL